MTADVAFREGEAAGFLRELRSSPPWPEGTLPVAHANSPAGDAWETWLTGHFHEVTLGLECPVVAAARALAAAGQARELIALDRAQTERLRGQPLAEASYRVGRRQLNRLRPLRDFRVVARYAAAVEAGEAQGWHTVVYGLTLAAYDLPLLPGLVHFARQTAGAWLDRCARENRWVAGRREDFEHRLLADLQLRLGPVLTRHAGPFGHPDAGWPALTTSTPFTALRQQTAARSPERI